MNDHDYLTRHLRIGRGHAPSYIPVKKKKRWMRAALFLNSLILIPAHAPSMVWRRQGRGNKNQFKRFLELLPPFFFLWRFLWLLLLRKEVQTFIPNTQLGLSCHLLYFGTRWFCFVFQGDSINITGNPTSLTFDYRKECRNERAEHVHLRSCAQATSPASFSVSG